MTLWILSGKGAVQIMPFRKLGGKCHFFLRFCTRKRSETYSFVVLVAIRREKHKILIKLSSYVCTHYLCKNKFSNVFGEIRI